MPQWQGTTDWCHHGASGSPSAPHRIQLSTSKTSTRQEATQDEQKSASGMPRAPIPLGTATREQCWKHTGQNHPFFLRATWLTGEGFILFNFKQDPGLAEEETQGLSEQRARKKGKSSRCQRSRQQPLSILRDPGMIHFLQCFKDAVLNCSCTFTACGNAE